MLRCDYKLNTACNRVSIEANTCIQFEKSDDESIPIGTPVLWAVSYTHLTLPTSQQV